MLQQEEVGILSREENTLAITPSKKKGVDLFLRVGLFLVHTYLELGNTGNWPM